LKGFVRLVYPPEFSRALGRDHGYAYFQEFVPNNESDTRVIVIDRKAFALKRFVRENDFRASGSGHFAYGREEFDERCVRISIDATRLLGSQCAAFDFVFDQERNPLMVEISYGFVKEVYDPCAGYWDEDLNWHPVSFNPQAWMVEGLIKTVRMRNTSLSVS
jgi:hypothetical protein